MRTLKRKTPKNAFLVKVATETVGGYIVPVAHVEEDPTWTAETLVPSWVRDCLVDETPERELEEQILAGVRDNQEPEKPPSRIRQPREANMTPRPKGCVTARGAATLGVRPGQLEQEEEVQSESEPEGELAFKPCR